MKRWIYLAGVIVLMALGGCDLTETGNGDGSGSGSEGDRTIVQS